MSIFISKVCMLIPLPLLYLTYLLSSKHYGYIMLIDCCIIIQAGRILRTLLGYVWGKMGALCPQIIILYFCKYTECIVTINPEPNVMPKCLPQRREKVCRSCLGAMALANYKLQTYFLVSSFYFEHDK